MSTFVCVRVHVCVWVGRADGEQMTRQRKTLHDRVDVGGKKIC